MFGEWTERTIPIELLLAAAKPSVAAFAYWLLFILSAAAVTYWIVKPLTSLAPHSVDGFFQAVCLMASLCLILGRPTDLSFPDVNGAALEAARLRCPNLGALRDSERAAAQFFVNLAANACQRRVVALWWATGAIWALSAYLIQKGFEARDGSLLSYALLPVLISFMSAGITAGYARSVNHVHGLAHALLFPNSEPSGVRRLVRGASNGKPRRGAR